MIDMRSTKRRRIKTLGVKKDVNEHKLTGKQFFKSRDVAEVEVSSSDEEEDSLDSFP